MRIARKHVDSLDVVARDEPTAPLYSPLKGEVLQGITNDGQSFVGVTQYFFVGETKYTEAL